MGAFDQLLAWIGLATAQSQRAAHEKANRLSSQLDASEARNKLLDKQLENAKASLASATLESTQLKEQSRRARLQRNWCPPELAGLPVDTPSELYLRTLNSLTSFMVSPRSLFDLIHPSRFRSPQYWALYWCLAHASQAALAGAKAAKDENGCSRQFLDALKSHTQGLPELMPEGGLQIAYNSIFEQVEPAMKEAAVGADILLIVAGNSIVPNGFARLFWLQGKKAKSGAYTLQYDQENNDGLQVDALAKVHQPSQGSFGLYALYSKALDHVPSVLVSDLPKSTYSARLSDIGTRLAELIVSSVASMAHTGSFADTKAILAYLKKVSDMKPLYVVTVTDGGWEYGHAHNPDRLLSTVSDYYREQLGLKREQDRTRDNDRGFER